jgi:polyisoprenyl-phosphate glycosyltransferase
MTPTLSIIIPLFNEAAVVPALVARLDGLARRLAPDLPDGLEVVCIDDGSSDGTADLLAAARRDHPALAMSVLVFSRNFGQQAAMTAGYDAARGQAVVCMDADLQDPPEVIGAMLAQWRSGCEVVYGVRARRHGETLFKRLSAWVFYRLMRRLAGIDLPVDAGDFRLMDAQAVRALRRLREHNRYLRGLVAWVGFRTGTVVYERQGRAAGETKYPVSRLVRLAGDAILSFSSVPLRLCLPLGLLTALVGVGLGVYAVIQFFTGSPTSGWSSIIVAMVILAGIQLCILGVIGAYLARLYDQAKDRPLYLVRRADGPATTGWELP